MAGKVALARLFTYEIEDDGDEFVEIDGITSANPSQTSEDADGNHFGLAGYAGHRKAQRGLSYSLEGRLLFVEGGDLDPGQARLKELGNAIGEEGMAGFRITSPSGATREGSVSVTFEDGAGGLNDNATWSATLTFDGQWTDTPPET